MLSSIFNSSEDPAKLSATVTGLIITASSFIIALAGHYGLLLTTAQVTDGATQLGIAVGSIWAAYGAIRKFVNMYRKPSAAVPR